jgi:hypothetical protein
MISRQSPQSPHRFVVRAIDPALSCSVLEAMLLVTDLETLRTLLGEDAADDAELRESYELDTDTLSAIADRFGVLFDPGGRECWLSRVHSIAYAPYLVHTGHELALMLDGLKPFAKFSLSTPVEPDEFPQEALFEPRVRSGRLIKRVLDEPLEKPIRSSTGRVYDGVRQIFYARPGEEWRIYAFILLWRQLDHGPWNETLERLDGSLLGYTDAQNDWWLARRRRDHTTPTFTDRTVYVAVDADELAWIRAIGERAFKPERREANLELVMHLPRPKAAILEGWLAESGAAAIIRVGLPRKFLTGRAFGHRDGARSYLIGPDEVLTLNRALTTSIEVVAEREDSVLSK